LFGLIGGLLLSCTVDGGLDQQIDEQLLNLVARLLWQLLHDGLRRDLALGIE